MIAPLRLPATYPGLIRECSPAVVMSTFRGMPPIAVAYGVVSSRIAGDIAWIANKSGIRDYPLRDLALNLTDPTGIAHATWWLAGHVSATWERDPSMTGWVLRWIDHDCLCTRYYSAADDPIFDDLDSTDRTQFFAAGMARCDVEALRRACVHEAAERAMAEIAKLSA